MVSRRLYIVALAACVLLPAAAQADLVLDDFDVPSFHLPNTGVFGFRHSEPVQVGDLNLLRTLQFVGRGADPAGRFDSAISSPSQLTAAIEAPNAVDDPFVQIDQRLLYFRDYSPGSIATIPYDISEGGRNTALVFDFLRLEGARPPDELRVLVGAHGTTFAYRHFDLPLTSEPFSLAIPFSDFRVRGGGPPPPVPAFFDTNLIDIFFSVRPIRRALRAGIGSHSRDFGRPRAGYRQHAARDRDRNCAVSAERRCYGNAKRIGPFITGS